MNYVTANNIRKNTNFIKDRCIQPYIDFPRFHNVMKHYVIFMQYFIEIFSGNFSARERICNIFMVLNDDKATFLAYFLYINITYVKPTLKSKLFLKINSANAMCFFFQN